LHKAVGASEGKDLCSCGHSKGGKTSEAYLHLKRELSIAALH